MYPRNAATPPRIAIGAVVQISDGAVQSSGVSVVIRAEGGSETAGGGTVTYGASSSVVYYAPTQAETNYTAFVVTAYKTGCIPVSVTVVTTGSATAGHAALDWGTIANKTTTNALTGTTISTSQAVASVSGAVGSVAGNVGGNVTGSVGSISGVTFPTNFGDLAIEVTTGYVSANVVEWLGTAPATPTVAGVPEVDVTYVNGSAATGSGTPDVNVVSISGDTVAADNAEAFFDGTGYAGTNNVIPTVTTATNVTTVNGLAANVITAASIASDAGTEIGRAVWDVDISGDLTSGLAGNTLYANVYTPLTNLVNDIGPNGSGLTALPWNAAWDAEVQSECTDALNAYDPPTNTEMVAAFTEIKGATWATTDTLEAIRDRGDAAWTTATGFSTHTAAQVRSEIDSNSTQLAAIVADTNELQADWANGGRLDLILDARSSQTSVDDVPTNAELAAAIITGLTTALTEGYRGTGATGSVRDMLYEIIGQLGEFSNSGTTRTVKKLDGTTTAKTYTYDSATTPTSITEAT